jgi:peroxiredoxin
MTFLLVGLTMLGMTDAAQPERTPAAPEFADISAWINSQPLKMAELKGKVVVIHFWTHGCINCIHNYPQYRDWATKFAAKDLVIVGVHTPEFDREKDVERIKQQLTKNKLNFIVAVDNQAATWKAWKTRYWPTVFLVDRQGRVRYHWEGELQEKGHKTMTARIDELLSEK